MSNPRFEAALDNTLYYEGRLYENVPNDPGGATCYGIDRRDNSNWPGWDILDNMQDKHRQALAENSDLQQAIMDYYYDRWVRLRCDDIADDHLAIYLFDCTINPGMYSVHVLQDIVGVHADSIIGNGTLAAINNSDPEEVIAKLKAWRINYYLTRGAWADSFKDGWVKRANEVRD